MMMCRKPMSPETVERFPVPPSVVSYTFRKAAFDFP